MNILSDDLTPLTFGEFIDALIITNIRMWHEQELIYEIETLKKMTKEEMLEFLKKATWLNLKRNFSIDSLDNMLADDIMRRHPDIKRRDELLAMNEQTLIWDQA
jgi:hypothetical protein